MEELVIFLNEFRARGIIKQLDWPLDFKCLFIISVISSSLESKLIQIYVW